MIRWIPYAFVRIVLFFMSGICLAIFVPDFLPYRIAAASLLILVLIYGSLSVLLWQRRWLGMASNLKFFSGLTAIHSRISECVR
jgi:hypothetical protein